MSKDEKEDEWYTPREVAELLKVNYLTVIRWLNKGEFKGLKVGRTWRIHITALHKMAAHAMYKDDNEGV